MRRQQSRLRSLVRSVTFIGLRDHNGRYAEVVGRNSNAGARRRGNPDKLLSSRATSPRAGLQPRLSGRAKRASRPSPKPCQTRFGLLRPTGNSTGSTIRSFPLPGLSSTTLPGANGHGWSTRTISVRRPLGGRKHYTSATLYETEFRLRRADGAYQWHIARAVPIKDSSGAIVCWIGTNTDVERQKASEAQLKLLAGELEHRMKNTMAMVAAIADQTFRTAVTKEEARKNFLTPVCLRSVTLTVFSPHQIGPVPPWQQRSSWD